MLRETKTAGAAGGGRQIISTALILTVILCFLPSLMIRGEPVYSREDAGGLPNGEVAPPAVSAPDAAPSGARDKGRVVRLLDKRARCRS